MATAAKLVVKNWVQFQRGLEKADKHRIKSAETATKIAGYRLMKTMKVEVKKGHPGGRRFSPLSEIAKRTARPMTRKPLSKLVAPIRYWWTRVAGKFEVSVGFPDTGISKSWLRIAKFQQEGGTIPITKEKRKALLEVGIRLVGKARGGDVAKYFFLKPTTTSFKVPARPIIEPFWRKRQARTQKHIIQLFERKMRGEYIK